VTIGPLARNHFWSAPTDYALALRDRQDAKTPRREPDEEVHRLAFRAHCVWPKGARVHTAQVLAYLKAIERQLCLLINFDLAGLASGVKRITLGPVA